MGEIRSALDIALEKTADIQSDKAGVENREISNAGKKAAGEFLSSTDSEALSKLLAGKNDSQKQTATEGALSVFLASLRLPVTDHDIERFTVIGKGLEQLLPNAGMQELIGQISGLFTQYLAERAQLGKALEQQFLPRLRAKQQELSKRYGQAVPMDPSQDPEYMAALNKNNRMLEQKYETVIAEARFRIREAAGIKE